MSPKETPEQSADTPDIHTLSNLADAFIQQVRDKAAESSVREETVFKILVIEAV